MPAIVVKHLSKNFQHVNHSVPVLNDVNLNVEQGEFVTIFGPNGCGKTTFLRILAGIDSPTKGSVQINGKKPADAEVGYVFQNYSQTLMPWLTSAENIMFPYSLRKRSSLREAAQQRLQSLLAELDLRLPLEHYPYQLSGGQQQMVVLLRALLYEPEVILLDEPFSALDYETHAMMLMTLQRIWQKNRPTVVFVSHDIEEALFLADRILLLSSRPATIGESIDIPFARPRELDLMESSKFFHLKRLSLGAFRRQSSASHGLDSHSLGLQVNGNDKENSSKVIGEEPLRCEEKS